MHVFFAFLLLLLTIVNVTAQAGTKLKFLAPRGTFNNVTALKLCDGFNSPSANRTKFPLDRGFLTFLQDKPAKTTISVSSASNVTSISDFSEVLTEQAATGTKFICVPLNFKYNANSTGLKDGQNVTLQVAFDTGDNISYQCAELTLASNYNLTNFNSGSNVTCSTPPSNGNAPTATLFMPFSLALFVLAVAFMTL